MAYRQRINTDTVYLKTVPLQPVSNTSLQVLNKFRKHVSCFYAQAMEIDVGMFARSNRLNYMHFLAGSDSETNTKYIFA